MDWDELARQEDDRRHMNVQRFVTAIRQSDPHMLFDALTALEFDRDGLRAAFGMVVAGIEASAGIRELLMKSWVLNAQIRNDVKDDELLLDALPRLLPPYHGVGRRLYRGEVGHAHETGSYGWAWSSEIDAVRDFAREAQAHPSGGLVLAVDAPAEAIFCAPAEHPHLREGECEYMVDRRVLARRGVEIEVVETLPHIPPTAGCR